MSRAKARARRKAVLTARARAQRKRKRPIASRTSRALALVLALYGRSVRVQTLLARFGWSKAALYVVRDDVLAAGFDLRSDGARDGATWTIEPPRKRN